LALETLTDLISPEGIATPEELAEQARDASEAAAEERPPHPHHRIPDVQAAPVVSHGEFFYVDLPLVELAAAAAGVRRKRREPVPFPPQAVRTLPTPTPAPADNGRQRHHGRQLDSKV